MTTIVFDGDILAADTQVNATNILGNVPAGNRVYNLCCPNCDSKLSDMTARGRGEKLHIVEPKYETLGHVYDKKIIAMAHCGDMDLAEQLRYAMFAEKTEDLVKGLGRAVRLGYRHRESVTVSALLLTEDDAWLVNLGHDSVSLRNVSSEAPIFMGSGHLAANAAFKLGANPMQAVAIASKADTATGNEVMWMSRSRYRLGLHQPETLKVDLTGWGLRGLTPIGEDKPRIRRPALSQRQ